MLRLINDVDASMVYGGLNLNSQSAYENQSSTQGKSPAGATPANKSGSTSSDTDSKLNVNQSGLATPAP